MLRLTVLSPGAEEVVLPGAADGHVQVWEEHGQICSYTYSASGHHWMHVPRTGTFRFRPGDDRVVAIPLQSAPHDRISEAFERTVRPTVLQALGREILHASAALTPAGVVSFSGNSGAGKSTMAYLMSRRGYPGWADDAVMFERTASGVEAVPLPFRVTLRADAKRFFGAHPVGGSTASSPAPLASVIFLARHQDQRAGVTVRELSATAAFKAVLSQAYCFDPQDRERNGRTAAAYLDLAARVPIFEMHFPSGFAHGDQLVGRVEQIVHEGA